jgi:hypothetical protein
VAGHRGDSRSSGPGGYHGRHVRTHRRVDNQALEEESLLLADAVIDTDIPVCECCTEGYHSSPDGVKALCYNCDHPYDSHEPYSGPSGNEFEWTS